MWFIVNTGKFQEQKTKEFLEETYPGIIKQVYLPKCRTWYQDADGEERFRLKPLIYGMVFIKADNPQVLGKILSHWAISFMKEPSEIWKQEKCGRVSLSQVPIYFVGT